MDIRLAVAAFSLVDDGSMTVTQAALQLGISRDSFYRYRRRFVRVGWLDADLFSACE